MTIVIHTAITKDRIAPVFLFCMKPVLHVIVAGSCNDIELLLSCQVNELDRITADTDREVCIFGFLRMLHCIIEFFRTEYIDIEVMRTLVEVTVKHAYQVVLALIIIVAECARADRLRIGDTVKCIFVRQLRY